MIQKIPYIVQAEKIKNELELLFSNIEQLRAAAISTDKQDEIILHSLQLGALLTLVVGFKAFFQATIAAEKNDKKEA
jgi:hypothetical protein